MVLKSKKRPEPNLSRSPSLIQRIQVLESAVTQLVEDRIEMCHLLIEDRMIDNDRQELEIRKARSAQKWQEFKASRLKCSQRLRNVLGALPPARLPPGGGI
ncbi:MAG: hypothetical protein WC789_06770 [Lentisphaeria bacterium]